MSAPAESPERFAMRQALHKLERHITGLKPDSQIKTSSPEIDHLRFLPLGLDENSDNRPAYYSALPASFLAYPDDKYDVKKGVDWEPWDPSDKDMTPLDAAHQIYYYFFSYISGYYFSKHARDGGDVWRIWSAGWYEPGKDPYLELSRYSHPEFRTMGAHEVREGPFPHTNTMIFNDFNAKNGYILQGELLPILRLMLGQLRTVRFVDHIIAPVLAFSFMGPRHARIIEAYNEGHTVVIRPSKLFDLRPKNPEAFRTLGQWYFAKPKGTTLAEDKAQAEAQPLPC